METIAEKNLKSVINLYTHLRQVGHTTAVIEGAKSCGGVIVVHNERMRRHIEDMSDEYIATTTIDSLDKLHGVSKAVTFDNAAIMVLAQDSLDEIDRLNRVIFKLQQNIQFQLDQVK